MGGEGVDIIWGDCWGKRRGDTIVGRRRILVWRTIEGRKRTLMGVRGGRFSLGKKRNPSSS